MMLLLIHVSQWEIMPIALEFEFEVGFKLNWIWWWGQWGYNGRTNVYIV